MNAVNQVQEASAVYAVEQHALLKSFDLLATAPEGIVRLRELILSLAVQGKLVPQDPNDEPASVLLQRIRAEKQALIKAGKLKKDKPLAEIAEEEKPFKLPKSWEWVRLSEIGYTQTGGTPDKKDQSHFGNDVPFIKPGDIYPEAVDYGNEGLTSSGAEHLGRLAPAGSVLMVCIGTIGKCNVVDRPCAFNQQINSITPFLLDPIYLLSVIRSPYFQSESWSRSSSTTISILNKGKWESIVVPVAPLKEQSRIVARVEELMQLCDALEQQGKLEAAQHVRLVGTLFDALANSESAHALAENWQRVAASFDLLLDRPEAVDALEQTLLQLAVRGLLVPQEPKDEPASELLKKIRQEKDHLIATGKLKRDKPLPEISEEEKPFELPQGWAFSSFSQLGRFSGGKTPSTNRGEYWDGNIPWVTPKDMKSSVITTAQDKVSEKAVDDGLAMIPPRSILIVARSGILRRTVPVAITEVPCTVNQDLKALELTMPQMAEYVQLMVMGFEGFILENLTKIGTTVESLRFEDFERQLFPVPPLAEQSRIVARVGELRQLCAGLRARLSAARTTQTRLAEALVAQAA